MTGAYNPDVRNPLPNATYTVDGRFHYTTDGWARTVRLEVGLLGVFRTVLVFLLQAAFFRSRKSLSTSLGVRYPRAE